MHTMFWLPWQPHKAAALSCLQNPGHLHFLHLLYPPHGFCAETTYTFQPYFKHYPPLLWSVSCSLRPLTPIPLRRIYTPMSRNSTQRSPAHLTVISRLLPRPQVLRWMTTEAPSFSFSVSFSPPHSKSCTQNTPKPWMLNWMQREIHSHTEAWKVKAVHFQYPIRIYLHSVKFLILPKVSRKRTKSGLLKGKKF